MNPSLKEVDPVIADRIVEERKARMDATPGALGCAVLLTAQGNLYSEVIPQIDDDEWERKLSEQLSQAGDTEVEYIYCHFPTQRLMKLLSELDPRNWEAGVLGFFPEGDCYMSKPLRTFQPQKK